MDTKVCTKCKKILALSEFWKKQSSCKACRRLYYEKNKEKIAKYKAEYYKKNIKAKKEYDKIYLEKNRDKINAKAKIYRQNNKEKIRKYFSNRSKNDLNYRIKKNLRNRLIQAIKSNQKGGSAIKDLGCTIKEFKLHIEKQFKPGMSWKNWGLYGWHLDHIKPLSNFDLSNPEEVKAACHYTNIQPLWAEENLRKNMYEE